MAFEQIAQVGARYVEVAFIEGYIDPFTEETFIAANAKNLRRNLIDSGLSCHTFSAHLDLSKVGTVEIFKHRLEFACELGAKIVISNTAPPSREQEFYRNIQQLAAHAHILGITIALENPGDGRKNLLDTGVEGARIIEQLGLTNVGLNYDFGNVVTHLQDQVRPEDDFEAALPHTVHLHIKDLEGDSRGWQFTEIGKGTVNYQRILSDCRIRGLPLSLEVPLRLRRLPSGRPVRGPHPVCIEEIVGVLKGSFEYTTRMLES